MFDCLECKKLGLSSVFHRHFGAFVGTSLGLKVGAEIRRLVLGPFGVHTNVYEAVFAFKDDECESASNRLITILRTSCA